MTETGISLLVKELSHKIFRERGNLLHVIGTREKVKLSRDQGDMHPLPPTPPPGRPTPLF